MSREITCDICKIKIGSKLEIQTMTFYGNQPSYSEFFHEEKRNWDVCNNCQNELNEAINEVIKRRKK